MNTTTMMVRTLMVSVLVLVISQSVTNAQLIDPDNPYQCTGYPHNITNFHYSGENSYWCHVCMCIHHPPYIRIHLTSQYHCNGHIKGTALGGWLVLEPWITPSLFYQFLGRTATYEEDTPSMIGMDRYVHLHMHISKHMHRLIDWFIHWLIVLLILIHAFIQSNFLHIPGSWRGQSAITYPLENLGKRRSYQVR